MSGCLDVLDLIDVWKDDVLDLVDVDGGALHRTKEQHRTTSHPYLIWREEEEKRRRRGGEEEERRPGRGGGRGRAGGGGDLPSPPPMQYDICW